MRCPNCGIEIGPSFVVNPGQTEKKKGPSTGCIIGIVVGFFLFIFFGGMFAAIAYPQYVRAIEYAKFKQGLAIADQVIVAQAEYKKANGKYANNFLNLNLSIQGASVNENSLETNDFTYQLDIPTLKIIRKENPTFNYKITANLDKKQAKCEGSDLICDRFKN